MGAELEGRRRIEVAALVRLGLGATVGGARPGPEEGVVDALVRAGALRPVQAAAVRALVARDSVRCGACGTENLLPDGLPSFLCVTCGSSVARSVSGAGPPRSGSGSGRFSVVSLQPGTQIGQVELMELLRQGAYGRVFKARHLELGRLSAVKIVAGAALDESRKRRFERELEALGRLHSSNIVKIHSAFQVGDAMACEMELIDGETLAARFGKQGALPWREAATMMAKIARAIAHAHEKGVVHRDLKPANIILRKDGEPVVADFGLTQLVDIASSLTKTGALVGTPAYMAPEALHGKSGPSSDVYGVGVILYEALAGRAPFEAEQVISLCALISDGACEPTNAPGAPADLERVRARAMAVDVDLRYPTALALAEDLERVLAGKPIAFAPRAATSTRPLILSALLAATVLVGVGLTVKRLRSSATGPPRLAHDVLDEARAALAAKDRALAAELATEAATLAGSDLKAKEEAARIAFDARDWRATAAIFAEAPALHARPELALLDAQARRRAGDRRGAAALRDKLEGSARSLEVTLLVELGRVDEALEAAARLENDASIPRSVSSIARGEACLAKDDLAGAWEAFARARRADATSGEAQALLSELEALLGAADDALPLAKRAAGAAGDATEAGALAVGAARLVQLDAAGRSDLERAREIAPSLHAHALARGLATDLVSGTAKSPLARAIVKRARRDASLAWDATPPRREQLVRDARASAEHAAKLFPRTARAQSAFAAALASADDREGARAAAERARALPGEDGLAAFVLALGPGAQDSDDSGVPAPADGDDVAFAALDPARVLAARARLAFEASAFDRAAKRANEACALAIDRPARSAALSTLIELSRRSGNVDPSRLRELQRFQDVGRLESRLAARAGDVGRRDLATLTKHVIEEPWEPVHRILRSSTALKSKDPDTAIGDETTAVAIDDRYAVRGLEPLLWSEGYMMDMRNPPRPLLEATWARFRAKLKSAKPATAVDQVAHAVTSAIVDLGEPTGERAPYAISALHWIDRAESRRPGLAVGAALRAIAFDRLKLSASADREAARFASASSGASEALVVVRAVLAHATGPELAKKIAELKAKWLEDEKSARYIRVKEMTGVVDILSLLKTTEEEVDEPAARRGGHDEVIDLADPRIHGGHATDDGEPVVVADADHVVELALTGGDVVQAEIAVPFSSPLVLTCDGETWELSIERPKEKEHRPIVMIDAGRVPASGTIRIASPGGRTAFTVFYEHSRAPEKAAADADLRRRAFRIAMGRDARSGELDAQDQDGLDPISVVAYWAACDEAWSGAGSNDVAWIDLVFRRLLGRAPDPATEAAPWLARVRLLGSRQLLTRVLARSQEFRRKQGL